MTNNTRLKRDYRHINQLPEIARKYVSVGLWVRISTRIWARVGFEKVPQHLIRSKVIKGREYISTLDDKLLRYPLLAFIYLVITFQYSRITVIKKRSKSEKQKFNVLVFTAAPKSYLLISIENKIVKRVFEPEIYNLEFLQETREDTSKIFKTAELVREYRDGYSINERYIPGKLLASLRWQEKKMVVEKIIERVDMAYKKGYTSHSKNLIDEKSLREIQNYLHKRCSKVNDKPKTPPVLFSIPFLKSAYAFTDKNILVSCSLTPHPIDLYPSRPIPYCLPIILAFYEDLKVNPVCRDYVISVVGGLLERNGLQRQLASNQLIKESLIYYQCLGKGLNEESALFDIPNDVIS